MNNFKTKQAVASVDSAQEATIFAAEEALALATFKGWLLARQNEAQRGLDSSSGDAFAGYCADFVLFADAARVVFMFEHEARG